MTYNVSKEPAAFEAVSISNDLYGDDFMSSFEVAKGFTKSLEENILKTVPDNVIVARNRLQASHKLRLILKSKATIQKHIVVGAMIEVYKKTGMNKRAIWSTPEIFLEMNHHARTFTVPGKQGKCTVVTAEDYRLAIPEETFASTIHTAFEQLDEYIENLEWKDNEEHMEDTGDEV